MIQNTEKIGINNHVRNHVKAWCRNTVHYCRPIAFLFSDASKHTYNIMNTKCNITTTTSVLLISQ